MSHIALTGQLIQQIPNYIVSGVDTNPILVTSQTFGTTRNNFAGEVGFGFTISTPITITSLGRWVFSGNSNSHLLTIRNGSCGAIIVSGTINCSGATSGVYLYIPITPTVLSAGSYRVMSTETFGGDTWSDASPITTTGDVSGVLSTYYDPSVPTCGNGSGASSYVPVNLKYHL